MRLMMMRRLVLCGAVLLGIAGCTADDGSETGDPGAQDTVAPAGGAGTAADTAAAADMTTLDATLDEWAVELSRETVPAGPVMIHVRNAGTMEHALEIEAADGQEWETDPIEPGGEVTMSVDLVAGEYKVYCPVESDGGDHESRGMVTRLRVQ